MAVTAKDATGATVSFKMSTSGSDKVPHHHVDSSALPTGASTEAKQDSILTSLAALATQATLATVSTTLSTISTAIAAINGKLAALGQTTMAGSMPVAIASNQSAVPVSGTVAVTGVATETTLGNVLTTTAFQARVPANGQGAMAASVPVAIASNQSAIPATATGGAASGAAVSGNPVRIGGSDGTTTRDIVTDTSGRPIVVGPAASGAAPVGNPVLIGSRTSSNQVQPLNSNASGYLEIVGIGAAGTPNGGIFSVQGVSGGTPAPVTGPAAHDAAVSGNPVRIGATSSAAAPTSVSADGEVVQVWALRNGAVAVQITSSGTLVSPATDAKQDTMITHLATIAAALTITDAYVTSVASANTTANTFGSQVVVAPVTITIAKSMTGTLTIDDGDAGAVVMQWDTTDGKHYPSHTFHVSNLNQLRYTFSVNAGTEIFYISSAT